MSKELTPWFPAHIDPAHVGFYLRDYECGPVDVADYWDGKRWWIVPVYDIDKRLASTEILPWRGLAKKP